MLKAMTAKLYILPAEALDIHSGCFDTFISPGRKQKIQRLNRESEKKLSLGAELCLAAASAELGLPVPPEYECGEKGKPGFSFSPPYFSLSHCEGYALCALSHDELGVDAEPADRTVSPGVIRRLLAPGEACPDPIWKWVEKESYVKLTGEGLSRGLRSFTTSGENVLDGSGAPLAYLTKLSHSGLCISVATKAPLAVLETELLSPEELVPRLSKLQ